LKDIAINYRAVIGLAASILALVLSFQVPWEIDGTSVHPHRIYTELAFAGAAVLLVATLVGAFISRTSFIIPGLVLAVSTWWFTESFFGSWVPFIPCGNARHNAAVNVMILLISTYGALIGGFAGRLLSKYGNGNVANAA
jgi:hypothetical protein